jgi:hypothetical protein
LRIRVEVKLQLIILRELTAKYYLISTRTEYQKERSLNESGWFIVEPF